MKKVYIAWPFFKSYWISIGEENWKIKQTYFKSEDEAKVNSPEGFDIYFINEGEVVDTVKKILTDFWFAVFSPKDESCLNKDSTRQDFIETFKSNIKGIVDCDFMLSIVEGGDTWTMVEFGYALAKNIPILAFSPVKMRKLNLMLSEACIWYASWYDQLKEKLENVDSLIENAETFIWEIE